MRKHLKKVFTEKPSHSYFLQWESPNIWAPMQYAAFWACRNAGYDRLAAKIAERYQRLLESNFEQTHNLWEKYDGITGQVVNAEYSAPPMMGWTAGVYLALKKEMAYQKSNEKLLLSVKSYKKLKNTCIH